MRKWRRRLLRGMAWARRALVVLAVLGLGGLAIVRWRLNGPNLANFIENQINPRIKGRIDVESVEWPLGAALTLRHVPVKLRGVKVYPDKTSTVPVLEVESAEGVINGWEIIRPGILHEKYGDILVEQLVLRDGYCRVEEYLTPEGPMLSDFYFLAAFDPVDGRVVPPEKRRPGPIFDLRNVTLENVHLELMFLNWQAVFDGLYAEDVWLRSSARQPGVPDFAYGLAPTARGAVTLDVGQQHFEFAPGLQMKQFTQERDDQTNLKFDLVATTTEGAGIAAAGALTHLRHPIGEVGGVTLRLDATNAGALVSRLSKGYAGGADLAATITLDGRYDALALRVDARGIDVHPGAGKPLTVSPGGPRVPEPHVEHVDVSLATASLDGEVHDLVVTGLDGKVTVSGLFDLGGEDPFFNAAVAIAPDLQIGEFLPPDVIKLAGKRLGGSFTLAGTPDNTTASKIDVHLGTARATGEVHWRDGVADTEGLAVDVPEVAATASARGRVDTRKRRLDLSFSIDVRRLTPWLRKFRAPLIATAGSARGTVRGSYTSPRVDAHVTARGVPVADRVDASIGYSPGQLVVKTLSSKPLGGEVSATGRLRLGRQPTIVELAVAGNDLDLSQVPGTAELLSGRAHFRLDAEGPTRRPRAQLAAGVDDFQLSGHPLGDVSAEVRSDDQGIQIASLQVGRAAGGTLFVKGRVGYDTTLDVDVDMRRLPLASLPGVSPDLRIDGDASLDVHLAGTIEEPGVDGTLALAHAAFGDTIFGAAEILLEDLGGGKVRLSGKLFQGKFRLDEAVVSLKPPFDGRVRFSFKRVEIDEFTDVLVETVGARGWASGVVELTLGPDGIQALVEISELHAEVEGEDVRGRPQPVPVDNVDPIAIEWDGEIARLREPVRLRGPTGEFTLEGSAGAAALDVRLRGKVELGLLEFFTRRWFDGARGLADMDVRVTGDPARPVVAGSLALTDAAVRPRGQDDEIAVPGGTITVVNDAVTLDKIEIAVDGQSIVVNGGVTLVDWQPREVSAEVHGRLAAKLLEVVAGRQFSGAGGSAALDLTVSGDVMNPDIDGTVTLDRDFEVAPRGLRREVVLTKGGKVRFTNQKVEFVNVTGRIDEGRLALDGFIRLYEWRLIDVDVRLAMDALAHQIPGILSVEMNTEFRLVGDADELQLRGSVEIIDGRYYQRFKYHELLLPVRTSERAEPFWKGSPLLENLRLHLKVETRGTFQVSNNIAQEMALAGELRITGTPPDPRFDGRITVEEGRVRILGLRPTFNVQQGYVTFSPYERVLDGTSVEVFATSDYTDREERMHVVNMSIVGPLNRLKLDLWTDTGLNFAQTLFLISAGKTADDLREQARGDSDPGAPRETTGGVSTIGGDSSTATAVDRVVKDFASDFVSMLVEDPLKQLTGLDCVRLEIGTQTGMVYACKKVGAGKIEGEYELGYRGAQRYRIGGSWKITDDLSAVGDWQRRQPEDETEEVEDRARFQLKFRYVIQ